MFQKRAREERALKDAEERTRRAHVAEQEALATAAQVCFCTCVWCVHICMSRSNMFAYLRRRTGDAGDCGAVAFLSMCVVCLNVFVAEQMGYMYIYISRSNVFTNVFRSRRRKRRRTLCSCKLRACLTFSKVSSPLNF